ncbi:hypothetical protein PanWU01x14_086710 [Parasponia andersonii]|uniref:Uncharacterized protein n=1 Tax=Parasponia andersonii TaxID=3476 RepID=A0A2P5D8G6_PARAD|nr:hypothetical protein PanWU01x14_086710 [Parasponia andersonii]
MLPSFSCSALYPAAAFLQLHQGSERDQNLAFCAKRVYFNLYKHQTLSYMVEYTSKTLKKKKKRKKEGGFCLLSSDVCNGQALRPIWNFISHIISCKQLYRIGRKKRKKEKKKKTE